MNIKLFKYLFYFPAKNDYTEHITNTNLNENKINFKIQ